MNQYFCIYYFSKQTDSKFISGFSDEVLAHIESKASRKMFNGWLK